VKLLFACLLCLSTPAAAQVSISAQISKTEATVDDQLVLSVTVSGPDASLPEPKLPPLSHLSIYDSGRSQSLSIVNGQVSSTIVYTFVVVPRAVGKALIPPITVSHGGKTAATEPIELNVLKPGSGMPGAPSAPRAPTPQAAPPGQRPKAGAPDMFVTAETDSKTPFVNQQVTLTVRFYTAVNLLQSPQYEAPALSGFLAEDLPPERHGQASQNGRVYYYSEIKTALFPAQNGRVTVGPAAVRAVVPMGLGADPFAGDFFDRFFQQGVGGREVRLTSDPLTLQAQPLPEEGKPAGFSGGVGRFSLASAVDRTRLKVGEAINLTVTVTGEGNLKTLGEPKLPEMPQLRVFDTATSLNLDKKGDVVHGSKVFKTILVPRVSGALIIPPARFHYFDPAAKAYRVVESSPITLQVSPGDGTETAGPSPSAPRGVTAVSEDLRYLRTSPRRSAPTRFLEAVAAAGPLHAAPFALLLGAAAWDHRRRRALSDPAAARARSALRAAQGRLRQARAAADAAQAWTLLADTLAGYLADKLAVPASGLTVKRALELTRVAAASAPAEALEEIRSLWSELDMRRFAPAAGGEDAAAAAGRLEALLARLEKEVFS
jgi:hypothetical protein